MKKIIFTIAILLTISAKAIQYVDLSTVTVVQLTNVGTYISIPSICTNYGPYSAVNTNFHNIGDLFPVAFSKVNTNFFALQFATVTNGSTANGQVPIISNSIPGGYYWGAMPTTNGLTTTNLTYQLFGITVTNVAFTNAGNPIVINQVGFFPTNNFGGGAGGSATNAWGFYGNSVTNAFIGTLTAQPFTIVANSHTGMVFTAPNAWDIRINGGVSNTIAVDSSTSSNRNSAIFSGANNFISGGLPSRERGSDSLHLLY